ncbi:MAG TPA: hypothetical protein VFG46_02230 [Chryseolinea sp.]|nr:hypothetical protein [Chryseolinea sp.]
MEKRYSDYHLRGDYRTPETSCPYCGKLTNGTAGPTKPQEGDISVCIKCYSIGILNADLKIRKPTVEEYADIRSDSEIWEQIELIRFALKETAHMVQSEDTEDKQE